MNTRLNRFLLYTTLPALLTAEFSAAAASRAGARAAGADDALEKRVADFVQNEMMMDRIPGLSVAVVHKGKVLLAQSFGYANPETKAPATAGTLYEIGSMTKQFTAAAVMLLAEQGKLGLDDPIAKFVGELPPEWSKITVRHLLTHTSGIVEFTKLPEFETRFRQGELIPALEVLKVLVTKPLGSQPGEKFSYCNTGFHLLGLVIEKASGQGYSQFMASHVFRPLGMTSTRVSDGQAQPGLAQGFKEPGRKAGPLRGYSAGGILSTLDDMTKWAAAMDEGKLLKKESLEQVWTQFTLNDGRRVTYGFGWIVDLEKTSGNVFVAHAGGTFGFASFINRLVSDQLTVVILTNAGYGFTRFYARGVTATCAPWFKETWLKDETQFRERHHSGNDQFKDYLKKAGVS